MDKAARTIFATVIVGCNRQPLGAAELSGG